MTRTELDAYDRGFIAAMNLRVENFASDALELKIRRRWQRSQRLGLAVALGWASAMTVAVFLMWRQ